MSETVKRFLRILRAVLLALGIAPVAMRAQAPEGPMSPQLGVEIQKAPAETTFKLRSVLVNTPVTVRNASGAMVHNLKAADFRILDNGVEQKITHFDLGGDPISLLVVVESSSRIEPLIPELRKTGVLLTQAVAGPTGEIAIVNFDDEVKKLQDFTTSAEKIEGAMAGLNPGYSGAKLYDAMALGVEMLSARPEVSESDLGHRRVMLVISETHDEGSEAKLGEVLRRAQLENVTIYAVGLSITRSLLQKKAEYKRPPNPAPDGTFGLPPQPGTVQTPTTENERYGNMDLMALAVWAVQHVHDKITSHALDVAVTATGGANYPSWKDRSIEKALDEIGGELHAQYTITYAPTGTGREGYHEISVAVDRKDLTVRARPGYYLAAPTPGT